MRRIPVSTRSEKHIAAKLPKNSKTIRDNHPPIIPYSLYEKLFPLNFEFVANKYICTIFPLQPTLTGVVPTQRHRCLIYLIYVSRPTIKSPSRVSKNRKIKTFKPLFNSFYFINITQKL